MKVVFTPLGRLELGYSLTDMRSKKNTYRVMIRNEFDYNFGRTIITVVRLDQAASGAGQTPTEAQRLLWLLVLYRYNNMHTFYCTYIHVRVQYSETNICNFLIFHSILIRFAADRR